MCGIAGGIGIGGEAGPDEATVRAMCRMLQHRGPDGEGIWASPDGAACLGHRRLSIIDLATGGQPMFDASGRRAIVFNGEIYNFVELRAELESGGRVFRTRSDTEVLLAAFDEWGVQALPRLVGMFAFAIWDQADRSLLLARDRVGKKPLFYLREGARLLFASSLGALRAAAGTQLTTDPRAIDLFLTLGYIPAPLTVYQEVAKLEAGTSVLFQDGKCSTRAYWDPALPRGEFPGTREEADREVDRLLHDAVRVRLRSDVPQGVFLSGGIDSSLVSAVAVREWKARVETFSMTFAEPDFDESAHAGEVAGRLGTRHHALPGSRDLMDLLPDYVRHFGEPFGDSSALNVWRLSEATRRHVTVVMGGDGGDEGFAGYDWYRTALRLGRIAGALPPPLVRGLRAGLGALPGLPMAARMSRGLHHLARPGDGERFASLRTFIGPEEVAALYGPGLAGLHADPVSPAERWLSSHFERAGGSLLRRLRYTDIRTYLADCLMPKVDVAAMAH
ncbi:MAG TPA: asparagine synthase (glutamine-hydrolyzing), partial [Gemmatimonadales bacterium]|nr:asparagine synthase (glutamine-hydrolyzing) [Gemmatimonadales bacterium]